MVTANHSDSLCRDHTLRQPGKEAAVPAIQHRMEFRHPGEWSDVSRPIPRHNDLATLKARRTHVLPLAAREGAKSCAHTKPAPRAKSGDVEYNAGFLKKSQSDQFHTARIPVTQPDDQLPRQSQHPATLVPPAGF